MPTKLLGPRWGLLVAVHGQKADSPRRHRRPFRTWARHLTRCRSPDRIYGLVTALRPRAQLRRAALGLPEVWPVANVAHDTADDIRSHVCRERRRLDRYQNSGGALRHL